MVKGEDIRKLFNKPRNIRNISIIAHVDHGKTTLTDSLISAGGIIRKEDIGTAQVDRAMKQQAERGITIKSTGISFPWSLPSFVPPPATADGGDFLINLIDSPGHVDFSTEVTAALRQTDGALVVIDCVEGVATQTETVLRQALGERIKPVLAINKLDRAFLELQYSSEEMYQAFARVIEGANVVLAGVAEDETLGDLTFDPVKGNVAFAAGLQGWAFSLLTFARLYSKRFKIEESKMVQRLWGDWFYNPSTKKFQRSPDTEDGKRLPRAFCQFVLDPLQRIFKLGGERNIEQLQTMLTKLGVPTKDLNADMDAKALTKAALQNWLPAAEALLEIVVRHLPSPPEAQVYRTELLYNGPLDDATASSLRACDPNGPLVVYIAKLVPNADHTRFFAFGRVFSGTLRMGQNIHVLGANYKVGEKGDHFATRVQGVLAMLGRKMSNVDDVPAGCTCAIAGIDKYIAKTGTLVETLESYPLKSMQYSISAVMRVAVKPKRPADLPKLLEGLKRLSKFDQLLQVTITEDGEYVVGGAGELHIQVCLRTLQDDILHGMEVIVSPPVVQYRETVTEESSVQFARSMNGHNRLFVKAVPQSDDLTNALEADELPQEAKARYRALIDEFGWDQLTAKKLWGVAPAEEPTNTMSEMTRGVQYLLEVKDAFMNGLSWALREGPLTGEPVRGVHFELTDALLHADAIHRGAGQIMPATRRVAYAAICNAQPRLHEPIYEVTITCPPGSIGGVHTVLSARRGSLVEESPHPTLNLSILVCQLPVAESVGFIESLREATSGQAFAETRFSHWAQVPGDPLQPGTLANEVALAIRKRKGMTPELPAIDHFSTKF